MSPKARVMAAWILLITSLICWPLTQLTIAKDEPTFTLGLSWFAVILTSWDILNTTDVRKQQEGNSECTNCSSK